uniref:Uncharacterized protein n=1 Tax=Oryza meridionalis TaxID=40149 RepID=A0A0E0C3S0_9ORYZ
MSIVTTTDAARGVLSSTRNSLQPGYQLHQLGDLGAGDDGRSGHLTRRPVALAPGASKLKDLLMRVAKKKTAKQVRECLKTRFVSAERVHHTC